MYGLVKSPSTLVIYCFPESSEQTQYRRLSVLLHLYVLSYSYIVSLVHEAHK